MRYSCIKDQSAGLLTIRDPMVLVHDGIYYLTGTQPPYWKGENPGVRMWSSTDMEHWTDHGLVLKRSDMPEKMWCRDRFWAPELFFFDGWFYLTFNCRNESEEYRHSHSVGLARSKSATGPYEILTKEHALTEDVPGDNDASLYAENGILYLLCNETHGIHMYKLDPETVTLSEGRKLCGCGADGEWDSIGVEGPCLVKRCGKYFLFYSSWTNGYNAGYCTADSLDGELKKYAGNPIIGDNDMWHDGGHNHCFTDIHGNDYITFHAFMNDPKDGRQERFITVPAIFKPDGEIILG